MKKEILKGILNNFIALAFSKKLKIFDEHCQQSVCLVQSWTHQGYVQDQNYLHDHMCWAFGYKLNFVTSHWVLLLGC